MLLNVPCLRAGASPEGSRGELIVAEAPCLRRVATLFARCEADADDVIQETMLRALRAPDTSWHKRSVHEHMLVILRRVFIVQARRNVRLGTLTDTDAGGPLADVPAPRGDVLDTYWPGEAFEESLDGEVRRTWDRLPSEYQTVLRLSLVEELSAMQLRQRLRLPAGTILSRIHRARSRMKDDLRGSELARALNRVPRTQSSRRAC